MVLYALYYKRADGVFEGPAVGLFASEALARRYVYEDKSCPRTEFEIVRHNVQLTAATEAAASG